MLGEDFFSLGSTKYGDKRRKEGGRKDTRREGRRVENVFKDGDIG